MLHALINNDDYKGLDIEKPIKGIFPNCGTKIYQQFTFCFINLFRKFDRLKFSEKFFSDLV